MQIEWAVVQSAVTAVSGLAGVWLGGRLTWQREKARERERNMKDVSYLAIFVVAHLDRLATACLQVALDDGTEEGRPAGTGGCYAPTVHTPVFDPLAFNVNWKALPADLMYEILGMPFRLEQLEGHVAGTWEFDDPPDYSEFFWARQYGYAELGLYVSDLARRLRKYAALPHYPQETGNWNRDDQLREQRDKVEEEREKYRRRSTHAPVPTPMS